MFSPSALILLNKNAFQGHLCQTVNNFVIQNQLSFQYPLRKRQPSQLIKYIRNTRVSCVPVFNEPCSYALHPLNFSLLYFWYGSQTVVPYSIKKANQRKASQYSPSFLATETKLGVILIFHGCDMFWPLQVVSKCKLEIHSQICCCLPKK